MSKKNAAARVRDRALFRVKSLRFFPARSLTYAFFAFVILFIGLLAVDRATGYEQEYLDSFVLFMMKYEKYNTGRAYPLMALKWRDQISEEHPKILVVGDSFVWGDGTSNLNQIWWSAMARELDRRGYDCQVYAVGYFGASTQDEFCWLRDTAVLEDIKPDLIVLGYVANDHESQMNGDMYDPAFRPLRRRSGDMLFPALYETLSTRVWAKTDYDFSITPIKDTREVELYDRNVVRPLGDFMQEMGIPLIVIPTPEAPLPVFEEAFQFTLPLFEKAGMPVYNPLDDFMKKHPNPYANYKYFMASRVDSHPGPATTWFLGEYAADVLEQNYASILGEKRTEEKVFPIEVNDWLPLMLEPRAMEEGPYVSQYSIEYPDQSSEPDYENYAHGNFLTHPLHKKYVKLNFKYPVRLSCVKIEGEALLSAQVWTLGINEKLGFDDQKPVKWTGRDRRDVTSLLISAKTIHGRQATLTVTIEGEVAM